MTGGAGFIGSHYLEVAAEKHPNSEFICLDSMSYSGLDSNVAAWSKWSNTKLIVGSVSDGTAVKSVLDDFRPEMVVHFAAQTHVDNSILAPQETIQANIVGTFTLLEGCRSLASTGNIPLFHHISTDEVFGDLDLSGRFSEESQYRPSSPYSASKAASDHLVRAWARTYNLPVVITNCSNNFGPRQYPEKLIPVVIRSLIQKQKIPVYGAGANIRDWLYVRDHIDALLEVETQGRIGETYCVGGGTEVTNLELVESLCRIFAEVTNSSEPEALELIDFVPDRLGHDFRYAIDSSKIRSELNWHPKSSFSQQLKNTVMWYVNNPIALNRVTA